MTIQFSTSPNVCFCTTYYRTNEMCSNKRKCVKKHSKHYRLWLEEELADFDNFWCKHFWHYLLSNVHSSSHHHHHHRQPWAQCPLVSDAIVTITAHRCLSRAAWLNSCRVAPHHCSVSSDHSRWGCPLLFEPSIILNTRVFIFLLSSILQIWPKRRNFLCITFCSRVSANWIFLYNSSLVTFCVHPILRIFR